MEMHNTADQKKFQDVWPSYFLHVEDTMDLISDYAIGKYLELSLINLNFKLET